MSEASKALSDADLELRAEIPDSLGGSAKLRADARSEIKTREREAAKSLADKQLQIAEKQAAIARSAAWAAWGSAVATFLACAISFLQFYRN